VLSLGALCTRLAVLAGTRDMSAWIEEDEGGKQSSVWDIISTLIERERLGYKEEEMVPSHIFPTGNNYSLFSR
jgi:cohesin complex subunit SA-1/2